MKWRGSWAEVRADIVRQLGMNDPHVTITGFARPNLRFEVKRTVNNAVKDEALSEILESTELTVDVAIVDLNLPDGSGTDLIKDLRASRPRAKALVLSAISEQRYLAEAIEAGAAGVMHKSTRMIDLVQAVRRLAVGEQLLSQQEVIEALRFIGR